jgi:CHAT domain-containing protein/Tfp pilus assembly protein PilF
LTNLAALYTTQSNYTAAEPLFQRALRIRETALGSDHPEVGITLNNLAHLYQDQGNYPAAEPLFQRALQIFETALGPEHPYVATVVSALAELYRVQGNYDAAEPLYARSLQISETGLGPNHPSVANSLNNLALLHYGRSSYDEAESLFLRALQIRETTLGPNHPSVATTLNNLAILYDTQGNYVAAAPLAQRALQIRESILGPNHPDVATSLSSLALLFRAQGDYASALPLVQRTLQIREAALGADHPEVAVSLGNLAILQQTLGNSEAALQALTRSLNIQERHLDLNLASLNDAQRQAYGTTLINANNHVISLNLQALPDSPDAKRLAFTTLLRRKGRILDAGSDNLQALRQNLTPAEQANLDALLDLRQQLASLVFNPPQGSPAEYQAEIERLETEANHLESQLARSSAAFRAETQPVDPATLQAQLPTDGVLVEYVRYRPYYGNRAFRSADRYAVYLLLPNGHIEVVDLGEAEVIDAAVKDFATLMRDRRTRFPNADARALAIQILDPIQPYLSGRKHLLISPDSQLNRIPFEALQNANGNYLVEQYQISYLNTGRDLLKLNVNEPSREPALIVANPDYANRSGSPLLALGEGLGVRAARRSVELNQLQVGPLPGTAAEAEALQALLPNATVLTEAEATENALKQAQSPEILHLATHGFFLENVARPEVESRRLGGVAGAQSISVGAENPLLRSGLAFAGFNTRSSGDEDGVLTALEVSGLNLLGTQLVVLSACETGLGDIANGEGVYGLRRAFALAGAETQTISLWSVDDDVTQLMMTRYYQNLLEGGMGRAEAMRQVQLELIESGHRYGRHPFYWAAFITTGDWRPLE